MVYLTFMARNRGDTEHPHEHGDHGHTHGVVDASIITSERGIFAVKWSFVGLFVTALVQIVVVLLSGSVGLLSDTIHNFGDAATAVPLWIAFLMAQRKPSKRFSYGYGRVEDLAGIVIVCMMLFSGLIVASASISRLFQPQPVQHLSAVA